jgi:hypothetical protein
MLISLLTLSITDRNSKHYIMSDSLRFNHPNLRYPDAGHSFHGACRFQLNRGSPWSAVYDFRRQAKTWGPVDGLGHAMFAGRMEEEAKLEFTITVKLTSRR